MKHSCLVIVGIFLFLGTPLGAIGKIIQPNPLQVFEGLKLNAFYTENSIRRDPDKEEERAILEFQVGFGSCAAFFVENVDQRMFVATARHCAAYKMTEACASGDVLLAARGYSLTGKCKQVIAGSVLDDMIVIEAEFDTPIEDVRKQIKFLRLIDFVPETYRRFQTIGFPGDSERLGRITVTENCWDNSGASYTPDGESTGVIKGNTGNDSKDPALRKHMALLRRKLRWYNCSTWGGNSGGPIIIEDTNQVAGLPGGYRENASLEKGLYPHNIAQFYEATAGFVAHNRAALEAAKVTIDSTCQVPLAEHKRKTLESMKYLSPPYRPRY